MSVHFQFIYYFLHFQFLNMTGLVSLCIFFASIHFPQKRESPTLESAIILEPKGLRWLFLLSEWISSLLLLLKSGVTPLISELRTFYVWYRLRRRWQNLIMVVRTSSWCSTNQRNPELDWGTESKLYWLSVKPVSSGSIPVIKIIQDRCSFSWVMAVCSASTS